MLLLALSLAACDAPIGTDAGVADSAIADAPDDAGAPAIAWGPCQTGFRDECAIVRMPLDHDDPGGETIDIHLSRRGRGGRQLWLLQGGPGASAELFYNLHDQLTAIDPELEVYTIEFRGVGDSTRLGCAGEGALTPGGVQVTDEEWPACVAEVEATWGDRLRFFSTTQAAHDLALAIAWTRRPDQRVFVYGGSYGTYWANRFGVYHPDAADGLILDAPVQPGAELHHYDLTFETVGQDVLALCAATPRCAEHLGPDPAAFVRSLFERMEAGHCSSLGVDVPTWRLVFGLSLMDYNLRNWMPAIAYRLDRCSAADQAAIATLFSVVFGGGGGGVPRTSRVTQLNVLLSELWPAGEADPAPVDAARDSAVFFMDGVHHAFVTQADWPRYLRDRRDAEYAPPTLPVLVMGSLLDPAAPPELVGRGYRDHLTGAHQTYVEIPYGAHAVLSAGFLPEPPHCSARIVRAFLADPTSTLPVECAEDVLPPSFDAPAPVSMRFFGTADLYD